MKLLSKTSLLIITASIFIFWIGNIVFFTVTKKMISQHINSDLMSQMLTVVSQIDDQESNDLNLSERLSIKPLPSSVVILPQFSDTVLYSSTQGKFIPNRALRFSHLNNRGNSEITIYKSLLSSDNLIQRITVSSIIQLIAFILMIYVLNRFIFSNVWSTFSISMKKAEEFDIKSKNKLILPESEIDEFEKLNRVLLDLVDRTQSDYHNLKELTANTSHEIQTPLAIIESKAELLLQSESLSGSDLEVVESILKTTGRLSKLNQSFLLIAKIENKQFEESETIDLITALDKYIDNLDFLFSAGGFNVRKDLDECRVKINPVLLDVLVTNLLKNSIMHGKKGGDIIIQLKNSLFSVSNSGNAFEFGNDKLFSRFFRGSNKQGSTGLGLEIVKKICAYYNIGVEHSFASGLHKFSIDFKNIARSDKGQQDINSSN